MPTSSTKYYGLGLIAGLFSGGDQMLVLAVLAASAVLTLIVGARRLLLHPLRSARYLDPHAVRAALHPLDDLRAAELPVLELVSPADHLLALRRRGGGHLPRHYRAHHDRGKRLSAKRQPPQHPGGGG